MKVVLLDNIRGIGRVGDIKEVSDGYARNFLLPRGLGRTANAGAVKEAAGLKTKKLEAQTMAHAQALEVAAVLNGTTVTIPAKANERGTLFSGIAEDAIAVRLSEVAAARIPPSAVRLDEHLKHIGSHTVHVALTDDVSADVVIDVVALQ